VKHVVIVAPSFAPSSHPPAIRTRFFATHLPSFGWRPTVLTVQPQFLEEAQDSEFLALLPPDLEVVRTPAIPQGATRMLGFGDLGLRSFGFNLHRLLAECRSGVDAVFIPGPPWYSFCLGPILRSWRGVPYILDYIDPWVHSLDSQAPRWSKAWAAYRLATMLERPAARHASAIVSVSEGTNSLVRASHPDIPAERFTAIPYGFETGDFETVRRSGARSRYLERFSDHVNVCYVGAIWPAAHPTLRAFFQAVRSLRAKSAAARRLRLHFLGSTYAPGAAPIVMPIADEEGISDVVTEHPSRIPYLEALRVLLSADLLVAVGSADPHYSASKIFPNLLAGRPLIAVFHEDSSVCALLARAQSGRLVTFSAARPVETKVGEIEGALQAFLDGDTFGAGNRGAEDIGREFSAQEMARRLARVLDGATAAGGNGR
jgi:glycosyl transferase family 4